jgi:ABC-type sugar transport system ATPase subunit
MQFTGSRAAEAEGIVMIHQEFNLAEDLSIAQIKTLMDGSNPLIQANVSYSPKFMYDAIKLTAEARLKGEKFPATISFRRC